MPPRSNIEVTSKPHVVDTLKGRVLVIPARINANLKAKTIEIQAQRRNLHMSLVETDSVGRCLIRFLYCCRASNVNAQRPSTITLPLLPALARVPP